jgi:class 3 adenylate cyclase/predicted ATPase
MEVSAWLESLGLAQYAQAFAENDVDAETLPRLTAEDLKDLGVVSVGHRRRLLDAIAALADATVTAAAGPKEDSAAVLPGERRQVTVLFVDLTGFSKLSSELDAEAIHDLLNRFFALVDGIVARFGGRIDKHIGDNAMAVFGAPVAHANDPERALRAAVEMHAGMLGLGESFGRPLSAHIGIASGQVVASGTGSDAHREYTVTGESVNLAARLQDKAGPGETLISEATYRAAVDLIDGEALGEVEVKGFARPVKVWRLRTLSDCTAVGRRLFVGRQAEIRQFTAIAADCLERRCGHVVLIRGEAGIGKTRLVAELNAIAGRRGFALHRSLVLDFGVGKGQDAIRTLVRSLLAIPPGSGKAVRRAAVEAALEQGLITAEQRVFLNDLLDLPQPSSLKALYDAMDNATRTDGRRAVVAALVQGADRPLSITIEDLHWADAPALGYLARIGAAIAECPAILVLTSRIDGDPVDQAWRASLQGTPLATVDLQRLRASEMAELARGFAEAGPQDAERCISRSEGNPLFLEQLLRSAEEGSMAELPGSIQSLVLARMDRLAPRDKAALQAAAVIGQRFELETLCHLLADARYDAAELVAHDLVRRDGPHYLFAHALVREGVYGALLQAPRRDLHERAAAWYAERDLGLRAEHLARADDAGAAQAFLAAARQQAENYRFERALQLVEQGLEIAVAADDAFALTCLRGELLHDTGAVARALDVFREALGLAPDDRHRVQAWIGLADAMRVIDDLPGAFDALDQAEGAAERWQMHLELAHIHYLRGNLLFPLGKTEACAREHQSSLAEAREAKSVHAEARAYGGLGDAYYAEGRMITAGRYLDQCIELSEAHGFGRIAVVNRAMAANTHVFTNDLEKAVADAQSAIEAASAAGHQRAEIIARQIAQNALWEMARFDEARAEVQRSLASSRRLGARRFENEGVAFLARILRSQGVREEAARLVQGTLEVSRELDQMAYIGPFILIEWASVTTDPQARRDALAEAEVILAAGSVSHNHFWYHRGAIDLGLELGDWDLVARSTGALEDYTRPEPLPWSDYFIARGRALAAFGQGRRDATLRHDLVRLREEGDRVGLRVAMPSLEAALAAF